MTCANCGKPTEGTETHHHNEQKGDNHPDNLQERCRRCHHGRAHDNPRAVDHESARKYAPSAPSGGV